MIVQPPSSEDITVPNEPQHHVFSKIARAAQSCAPVSGLTHNFYRYPARFSPTFARAAINAFTKPGDWVLDPFAGGGTTLVEAAALGRNCIGVDISSLANFVCAAKTLILPDEDAQVFRRWASHLEHAINMRAPSIRFRKYAEGGYYRNLDTPTSWRLRKAIEQSLTSAMHLHSAITQTLARCVVLRTAQWALDARKTRPSIPQFRQKIQVHADAMLQSALRYRDVVAAHRRTLQVSCLHRSVEGIDQDDAVRPASPPRLVLTSPPYPGFHVLYHRWQVDGRRETPAPFWIAGKLDGAGASYYTFGGRQRSSLDTYFDRLKASFRSIANVATADTTFVQLVAFSDPIEQLPRYLDTMESCGLRECRAPGRSSRDGRIWRDIPNRRWYNQRASRRSTSQEVVLFHRPT